MLIQRRGILLWTAWLLGALALPGAAQQSAPPVYNPANGHWYQLVRAPAALNWPEARQAAQALSYAGYPGHLATISSDAERDFINANVTGQSAFEAVWLGGYQDSTAPDYREPDGGWRWVTGEPFGPYTHWYPGQPDNDGNVWSSGENVLEFDSLLGNWWNDYPENNPQVYGYIVEFEPGPLPGFASVAQFLLVPDTVAGGQRVTGQVTLSQLAGPGGVVVPLASSNPAAAVPPATVTVPGGTSGVTFPVITFPVASPTPVILSAGGPGGTVTATLQVLPNPSPPNNLLVNGSFEEPPVTPDGFATVRDGGLPGWQILRGSVDVQNGLSWPPAPDGGHQSIDLVVTPGAATIEQTLPTVPGQSYLFAGWISHNPDNPVAPMGRANVSLNGQFFVQLYHYDPQTTHHDLRWVPFAYEFTASSWTTTLTLADVTNTWDAGGGLLLDGLSVTPVTVGYPPPPPPVGGLPAPTGLAARFIPGAGIQLTWQDNSSDETAFALWRQGGGAGYPPQAGGARIAALAPHTTAYFDANIAPGQTYTYRVRVIRTNVASGWSNEAMVGTLP